MIGRVGIIGLLSISALGGAVRNTSVAVDHGDIYVTSPDGKAQQITSLGKDFDPSLSLDGRYVVFARSVPGPPVPEGPRGPQERSEIWIIGADGTKSRRIFSGEVKDGGVGYVNFFAPHLSLDDHLLYFLIPFAATSNGLVRLDLRTSQLTILTKAVQYTMLTKAAYRGYFVVQRRIFMPITSEGDGGATYPFWLYSPSGEAIRRIAYTEADALEFIRQYQ